MKMFSILTLGLVVGVGAISLGTAQAQVGRVNNRRGDEVCVYKDINYFGPEQCYRAGEEITNLGAQNNSISSIRIYGRTAVTVYEKPGYTGRSAQFTTDVSDLGRQMMQGKTAWSDHIASLRIVGSTIPNGSTNNGGSNNGGYGRNQTQQPRDGVCVYELPNYGGRSDCWNQGQRVSDVSRQGNWNGQISSIRLFGDRTVARVYQNTGYRGESMVVDRSIPDLSAIIDRGNGNGNGNGNGRGNGNGNGNGNGHGNENGNGNGREQGNERYSRTWDRQISSLQIETRGQYR